MLPKTWKKLCNSAVVIPKKMKLWDECNDKIVCDRCKNQISEDKGFEAILTLSKRQPANQFGHMVHYYEG